MPKVLIEVHGQPDVQLVTLKSLGRKYSVKPDERGEATIANVEPGNYAVRARRTGYAISPPREAVVPNVTGTVRLVIGNAGAK